MTVGVTDPRATDLSEYGEILSTEGRDPDADTSGFRFWDCLGKIDVQTASIGIVRAFPTDPRICTSLERHGNSSETLIPVEGEIVVVCALSKGKAAAQASKEQCQKEQSPVSKVDFSSVKAVPVKRGEALLLKPGVWHYAPMVTEHEVNTFVIFQFETLQRDIVKEEGLQITVEG